VILGFHCIFTAYGFWLPNEPRGSWSNYVASWNLLRFGPATKVDTRQSVTHHAYDHNCKRNMQAALRHEPVLFTDQQAAAVAAAIGQTPYALHALAVMPDHVHLVMAHTDRPVRRAVGHIKSEATRALRDRGCFCDHKPWADHGWNVYLDTNEDMQRAIRYVENNPVRERLPPQRWPFVIPYDPSTSRAAQARRKRRG